MKRTLFSVILVAAILLVGCNTKSAQTYAVVSSAEMKPGDAIPVPSEEAILTVSGRIGITNVGNTLSLDLATLERFGLVKYEVNDPWLGSKNLYTGVLMSEFLKFIGAASDASISS